MPITIKRKELLLMQKNHLERQVSAFGQKSQKPSLPSSSFDTLKPKHKISKKNSLPTVDTCVLSGKPIRQKDIDNDKTMNYGKGRAFITAIKKSVSNPPSNPIVLSGQDLETVTLDFELWHFPNRVKIAGKEYSSLPPRIYLQNAAFKLTNDISFSFVYSGTLEETQDGLIRNGKVTYVKIPDHHKIAQKPLDNPSK